MLLCVTFNQNVYYYYYYIGGFVWVERLAAAQRLCCVHQMNLVTLALTMAVP